MTKWNDYIKEMGDPIERLSRYLRANNVVKNIDELNMQADEEAKKDVTESLKAGEKIKYSSVDNTFNEVYESNPWNIIEQQKELDEHLAVYGKEYPMEKYATK